MQINKQGVVAALMMTTLVVSPLAEAKRMGGGKSYGMSRSNSSSSSYNSNNSQNRQTATPAQQGNAQPQRSGPGVGTMVAAGVAGAAVGAVAANAMANDRDPATSSEAANAQQQNAQATQTEPKSSFSWFWIAILAIGAFFLFRRFSAKKAATGNPFSPNSAGPLGRNTTPPAPTSRPFSNGGDNTNIFGQSVGASVGGAYSASGQQLPDGTEPAAFLRQARAKFLHLQSMNSSSNIEEVRRYFTPDMYAAIREDILSNDDLAEFPQLNAQVVDSGNDNDNDNGQYFASVQFNGTVSESVNAQAVPFTETWHFVKPANSSEWLVAGIQQN
ncbi:MAG: Tim44 domain-containing protein [Moraxellaceae bacterium]|nr:MAG: Tim44 domain-containing protein [Moraxellaceae bacterium]